MAAIGIIVLYDLLLRRPAIPIARLVPAWVLLSSPLALFLVMRATIPTAGVSEFNFVDNPIAGAGYWTGLVTALSVSGRYLWLVVLAARLVSADYSYAQVPIFEGRAGGMGRASDGRRGSARCVVDVGAGIGWSCFSPEPHWSRFFRLRTCSSRQGQSWLSAMPSRGAASTARCSTRCAASTGCRARFGSCSATWTRPSESCAIASAASPRRWRLRPRSASRSTSTTQCSTNCDRPISR